MIIPCKEIAQNLKHFLKQQVIELKKKGLTPHLQVFLVGDNPEQLSFIRIKKRIAEELNINYQASHFSSSINPDIFFQHIQTAAEDPHVSGIIVQLPLPPSISSERLYKHIPPQKDIEGHIEKSIHNFPLSLAVLATIKYLATGNTDTNISIPHDNSLLQTFCSGKKIIVAGRGATGGKPISKLLAELQIKHEVVHSQTPDISSILRQADIIITATGKKIINPFNIKQGVVLLNVGLRHENNELKGDYDEHEIQNIASWYTQTPGGIGPLDVLYLYKNLVQATSQLQPKK